MKKKIGKFILWIVLSILMAVGIVISEKYNSSLSGALFGALIAIFIEKVWLTIEDLFDTTNWKVSQRKLKRADFIKDDTNIRISFAYFYRIKLGCKYLLVQNSRTGKYQPVGGVYKLQDNEKIELKNLYHIIDDDKILINELSKNDYRLIIKNKYLRKFVNRFNNKNTSRERIDNISREFIEEVIKKDILDWENISYRYCGRFMSNLQFDEHFQIYELQLFDIVELIPTQEQEQDLSKLAGREDKLYRFATAKQIISFGIDTSSGKYDEWIGDHTKTIIQENEAMLMKMPEIGRIYGPINLRL